MDPMNAPNWHIIMAAMTGESWTTVDEAEAEAATDAADDDLEAEEDVEERMTLD